MTRLLFGPTDDPVLRDRFTHAPAADGHWGVFGALCPSWDAAAAELPGGSPDAVVVWGAYTSIPAWVWAAPVPVVVAAPDANLLWHSYRHLLPLADLVLADAPTAGRLRRAGIDHVRAANLFGLDRHFAAAIDEPDGERDVDVLFVGNVNPSVQGERLSWLGRVAALADRFKVVVAAGAFGAEYRALLRRAKLAFNRSVRGECNLRALEAAASGAVLLQEAENREVPEYLAPGEEYAPYTAADLEAVVARLLGDGSERRRIAEAARDRARWWTFEALVRVALAAGGKGWDDVKARARARRRAGARVPLAGRVWRRASLAGPDADPTLAADLAAAGDRHAPGVFAGSAAASETHFAAAAAGNRVSAAARGTALVALDRPDEARAEFRRAAAALEERPELSAAEADSVPYPMGMDHLRTGWERAGFDHPDAPARERAEKSRLLRAEARVRIAELTGDPADWEAAAADAPEWHHVPAGWGAALLRTGRAADAVVPLRAAVAGNPLDNPVAEALHAALVGAGLADEAERLRAHRRVMARGAPGLVAELAPPEPVPAERAEAVPPPERVPEPHGPEPASAPAPEQVPEPVPPRPAAPRAEATGPGPFVDLSERAFAFRFGTPDTTAAIGGAVPPDDTRVVLTLLARVRPRKVLEVGAGPGDMTANLTAFTPPDADVYVLGTGAAGREPGSERPAAPLDHFGTGHKALVLPLGARSPDLSRLAPLDFAFVDARDADSARAARPAYRALRPGGCLAWRAAHGPEPEAVGFPEPVYRVAGTGVTFLLKGEGVGAAAGPDSGRVDVTWDGDAPAAHPVAAVNRAVRAELVARGNRVAPAPRPPADGSADPAVAPASEFPDAVHVRHGSAPDFAAPAGTGAFVLVQPWGHGRVPLDWVDPIRATVDEVWVYSRAALRAFVASGVPEDRVAVVPPGVDPDAFRPGLEPLPVPATKTVKLLFVGEADPRAGLDVLLAAYARAFTSADDVCLVVAHTDDSPPPVPTDPAGPEVVHLTVPAGADRPRLYAACDALVLPYRVEGVGSAALEALACGLPVVATAGGPTDEFVPPAAGWRVPARLRYHDAEAADGRPTAGFPWWLEPDADALAAVLREVATSPDERRQRGDAARRAALGRTWARTAEAVEDRVRVLRARTPVRFRRPGPADAPAPRPAGPERPTGRELASLVVPCCNEVDVTRLCLESTLAHTRPPYELVLVDNGSTDGTAAYLEALRSRPGPERVTVVTNATNRGYPAGVNQGLAAARGEYVVLLNNDVVLTPGWLDRLVGCALHEYPSVGLVGPVTNYAPPPQFVEPGYAELGGLVPFAARRAAEFASQAVDVPRLTGFCLLVRRAVLDRVGGLDERFGLGFFDDDDLCLRARRAGFRLALTLDCYVHHFGSRTFRALGVDTGAQLDANLALYRDKWGADEAARYRRPAPPGAAPADESYTRPAPFTPAITLRADEPLLVPAGPAADARPRATVPAVAGRPRVSLTMIVRNEERHLPECLASVRDLVDEAVVVDTGSTDRTREIARSFGCAVAEFPWVDHFAAARNAALDPATGDYCFWMDADDRLDDANRAKLRALFGSLPAGNVAFVMKCLCVGEGAGGTGTAVDHVRLFRRDPAHRWTYRVHEQILPALRTTGADVRWSDVCVRHVGYVDPAVRRRKLDRDLRLLRLDEAERPDDPFTLFNLGSVYHETGDARAAADALEKSLAGSHPKDSIVRKTYALLARCRYQSGDRRAAEAVCRRGREHYPDDAELAFLAAGYAREGGDGGAAEALYRRLIDGSEGPHFASVDTSLRAVKGRHNLAVMLLDQNRLGEAEALWRAALSHDPQFLPAQVGLGEVAVKAGNRPALDRQVAELEAMGENGAAEAAVLEARWRSARGDHAGAAAVLEGAVARLPRSLGVRVALSHVRIAADAPPDVLEAAFKGILELDPHNDQARRNLTVLYHKTGRTIEGVIDTPL